MRSLENLRFDPFPEIRTPRLLLRRLRPDDAPAVLFLRSDALVLRFLDRDPMETLEQAEEWIVMVNDNIDSSEGITWGISVGDDPALVGTVGVWRMDKAHFRGEVGYTLHPDCWGKGYMLEAMGATLHYAFEDIGLHSLEANVHPGNNASIKLLERCGFVREAYFRENWYHKGVFSDSAIYCLIDPKAQRGA